MQLWRRFAPVVWGAGILIVGTVAFLEWRGAQQARVAGERIVEFEAARAQLEAGEYQAAQQAFRDLVDADAPISKVAAHYLGRSLFEGGGDAAGAAEVLAAAGDGSDPLEKLALLKSAYLTADGLTLAELEANLGGLAADEGALGALALELIAAKAFAEGDLERARREFNYLRFAPNAPGGVGRRAEAALALLPPAPTGEAAPDAPAETPAERADNE